MSRRLAPALCALTWLVSGCTNFPDIPTGECGNGVIDEGTEDCDTFAPNAKSSCRPRGSVGECRLDCSHENECPATWGCDSDFICRKPNGAFEPLSKSVDVAAWSLTAGDFDGDGRDDVMSTEPPDAIGVTRLRFLYFDALGGFAESHLFPKLVLAPAVRDLDADGLSDVTFSDGRIGVMLGRSDRNWVPATFSSYQIPRSRVRINGVYDTHIETVSPLISLIEYPDHTAFQVPSPTTGLLVDRAPLAGKLDSLVGDPVNGDLFEDTKHSPCQEIVFAQRGARHFSVLDTCDTKADGSIVWRPQFAQVDVALTPSAAIDAPPLLVDLDGDKHLDVVIGAGGRAYVAFGNGTTLAKAVPYLVPWRTPSRPDELAVPEAIPMPLAIGDFTGDGAPDFVLPDFLVASSTAYAGAPPVYSSNQRNRLGAPWTSAVIADFNGNGKLDIAAASNRALNVTFFNNFNGNFIESTVSTAANVETLVVGDFDSDTLNDLALVEQPRAGTETSTLKFSFGAAYMPLGEAVASAELTRPEAVTTYRERGVDSILVCASADIDGVKNGTLTFLGASSDRVPFAPFSLTEFYETGSVQDWSAIALSVGDFTGAGKADLLSLAFPSVLPGEPHPTQAWLLPELLTSGSVPKRLPRDLDALLSPVSFVSSGSDFVADVASASADMNGDGRDEAVFVAPTGADRKQCGVLVVTTGGGLPRVTAEAPVALPEPCADPQVAAVDLDGDEDKDLLVLTGQATGTDRKLHVLWNDGSGGFSAASSGLVSIADDSPQAFTVLPAAGERHLSVVYVTGSLLRILSLADNGAFEELQAPQSLNGGTGVAAADVNGDHVADLVVAESGKLRVMLSDLGAR